MRLIDRLLRRAPKTERETDDDDAFAARIRDLV